MKIAVCIKRVPEMDVKFRIAASGTAVDETGLKFDVSDFDGYAVEFALQVTEKLGTGEVVVISLGPDAVQETLRKALSMGVARAVHLQADAVPADGFAIAQALAAELKDGGYDLVLFGKMAADSASGAVGLMTAELLGLPMVQSCSKLEVGDGKGALHAARSRAAPNWCRSRCLRPRRSTRASRVRATRRSRASWRRRRSRWT